MTSMNIHPPKPSVNLKETRRLAAIELSRQRAEAKQRKAEAKAKK